jgi:hypothetical protein
VQISHVKFHQCSNKYVKYGYKHIYTPQYDCRCPDLSWNSCLFYFL